jgi:hypothetical protein
VIVKGEKRGKGVRIAVCGGMESRGYDAPLHHPAQGWVKPSPYRRVYDFFKTVQKKRHWVI